jgi:hypothetical protein
MLIPDGEYHYEIRRGGELLACEDDHLHGARLTGVRLARDGSSRHQVEADLSAEGLVRRVVLRYARGPFTRTAVYDTAGEFLRGSVSALAGREQVTFKLGRFREVDGDLVLFRALTIAHIRARGQTRWTGRVAVIDPASLVAISQKQSCRQSSPDTVWLYEPRMGDSEEIELDAEGRIVRRRDGRGTETVLASSRAR